MDDQNTSPRQALLDKLRQSKNILVTVSANPSVDQLAACLGLTLWLNKADKHATAVFSGEIPSTMEFLQPEETLEKNTDSLRDFIIALDKTRADKLRYKVEDSVVKVFITPYRTSLTAQDLEFSQGDFNIDMVVALGVQVQDDLDTAVVSHGRILHDATVATITVGDANSELGSIHWHDAQASSLCELVVDLGNNLGKEHLDNQIATALLTGVVAETERFSNEKTSPQTMSLSAQLMSAGANQQLVASKLDEGDATENNSSSGKKLGGKRRKKPAANDGSLEIDHEAQEPTSEEPTPEEPAQDDSADQPLTAEDQPADVPEPEAGQGPADNEESSRRVTEPPEMGGTLTANAEPDDIMNEPTSDALSQPAKPADQPEPLLSHDESPATDEVVALPTPDTPDAPTDAQLEPPTWMPQQSWMQPTDDNANDDKTLAQLEQEVDSPHIAETAAVQEAERPSLDTARDEVMKAIDGAPGPIPEPAQALNAASIDLNPPVAVPAAPADNDNMQLPPLPEAPAAVDPDLTTPVEQPFTMPLPVNPAAPAPDMSVPTQPVVDDDPNAPPPVPPPLPFAAPSEPKS